MYICILQTYPLVWILMTHRTTEAYVAALNYVNENIFPLIGRGIIIDFEKAMRASIKTVAPNLPIYGCWFHFAQALRRKMASMKDLFDLIRKDKNAKLIFRKFQCLALLPAHSIMDAFVFLLHEALREHNFKEFAPFISYFKKEWLEIVKPIHFSVFDQEVRTTGSAEAYNGKLNKKFRTHGTFFNFVESLQREELSKSDEFQRHVSGKKQSDRRHKFYVRRAETIQLYWNQLKSNTTNFKLFLNIMSDDSNKIFYDENEMDIDYTAQEAGTKQNDEQQNVSNADNHTIHVRSESFFPFDLKIMIITQIFCTCYREKMKKRMSWPKLNVRVEKIKMMSKNTIRNDPIQRYGWSCLHTIHFELHFAYTRTY